MKESIKNESENQSGILTLDVFQKDTDIVIKSAIAGVSGKDLDIAITKDAVTIKGSRQEDKEETKKDYFYKELYWGSFSRTVILPEEVNPDQSKATLKNGVLMIVMPKVSIKK